MEEARIYPIFCFIMLCDSRQIRNADSPFRALYCQSYSIYRAERSAAHIRNAK